MTMNKYDRNHLENLIVQENEILYECVAMLNRKIPLHDWPCEVRAAFLLALRADGEDREAYKAFIMARHLRIGRQFPDYDVPAPTSLQRRCSERIRADMSGLVRLGAGSHLFVPLPIHEDAERISRHKRTD
ncbi:MAG: hypothetical protein DRI57_20005 [Deltaproteobacteria bacterium]|nr:MAG: hypothetical protein DRI57_20005 [Deltaproteobacteria bacterium]